MFFLSDFIHRFEKTARIQNFRKMDPGRRNRDRELIKTSGILTGVYGACEIMKRYKSFFYFYFNCYFLSTHFLAWRVESEQSKTLLLTLKYLRMTYMCIYMEECVYRCVQRAKEARAFGHLHQETPGG